MVNSPVRTLLLAALVLVLQACKHPLAIFGEGDILSSSGTRDCYLEDFQAQLPNCTENEVLDEAYVETYTAMPRPGWHFRRWTIYCKKALNNECSFNVGEAAVQNHAQSIFPALQAVFRPDVNTGFTALFMGNERFDPVAAGVEFHALGAGFLDHATTTVFAAGDAGAPKALWDDAGQRAAIQAVLDSGDIELVGMTYSAAYPAVNGYKNWINYALAQRPDTRFFIAAPWSADPAGGSAADYAAAFEATHAAVHALVDELRAAYPGVDIYCVPLGQAAVELYHLYEQSNLPDVSALVGAPANAVFQDADATPGDILVALGELLWLGALYDVDLAGYTYDPGYLTDLKALAQGVVDGHAAQYNAPDEVDVDTDGDGIVDRLDPNPDGKPNILLIVPDDMGYNDLSINNGNPDIDTPNLDQIATEGVRFTRHYASPVCGPARAALLTGFHPERLGYLPSGRGISAQVDTLPDLLGQAGYTTWHIGKWHLGDLQRSAWPDYQGFDHWFGFLNQWRLAGAMENGEIVLAAPRYNDPWLEGSESPGQHYPGHLTNILTDKALEVITELDADGAPWFVNLWYYAPHSPITPDAAFAQLYPDTDAGRYRALVNQMDFNIGRVVDHLENLGVLQDTILVVVSDNGGTNAAVDSNAPFVGTKQSLNEGGLRTPLLIRWPDGGPNGQVIGDSVSIMDILPTLLEAIGVTPPPGLDGVSFYTAVDQGGPVAQRELFWEFGTKSYGVLSADGNWKLYQLPPVFGLELDPFLYDLGLDPTGATRDDPPTPAIIDPLLASYEAWYRDVHTVATDYTPDGTGGGTLTGMDLLRSPGQGTYTFGTGIPDTLFGQIAAQPGVWSMSRSGSTVTAQFGSVIVAGDIVQAGPCHSIVVTGDFDRAISTISPPDFVSLSLYIDGELTQSAAAGTIVEVDDPAVATIVGDPGMVTAAIGEPVVLNVQVDPNTPWTVEDFSQELCAP